MRIDQFLGGVSAKAPKNKFLTLKSCRKFLIKKFILSKTRIIFIILKLILFKGLI